MSNAATEQQRAPSATYLKALPDTTPLDEAVQETERRRTTLREAAAFLGVPAHKIYDILRNLWKPSKGQEPLTNNEIFNGLVLIARFELDPFAREIYVTRGSHGLMVIIGIDGWVKILDRTDHYDGFDREYGYSGDGKEVLWIQTTIYSTKRKHPTVHRALMAEYKRICGPVASQIPVHMLGIFSLRHAARLFVPLGAYIVTEEEAKFLQREEVPTPKEPSGNARLRSALQSRKDTGQPPVEGDLANGGAEGVDAELTHLPESQEDPTPEAPSEEEVWLMEGAGLLQETDALNEVEALRKKFPSHFSPPSRARWNEACDLRRERIRGARGGRAKGQMFDTAPETGS